MEARHLYTRLSVPRSGARILDDQIARLRLGWQFTRALSLRAILQYEVTRSDAALTAEPARRNLNADLLLTYRIDPWTAVYLGYNGNARDVALVGTPAGPRLLPSRELRSDARQIFLKVSLQMRF